MFVFLFLLFGFFGIGFPSLHSPPGLYYRGKTESKLKPLSQSLFDAGLLCLCYSICVDVTEGQRRVKIVSGLCEWVSRRGETTRQGCVVLMTPETQDLIAPSRSWQLTQRRGQPPKIGETTRLLGAAYLPSRGRDHSPHHTRPHRSCVTRHTAFAY